MRLKRIRLRLLPAFVRQRGDVVAVFVLFALTVVAAWDFLSGEILVGPDAATQYYPWYSFLGESLRSGEIPGWNPHQVSGTPFAADPLSGWTYLPAMLFFTFLPLVAAAKSYLFFHLLLAGWAAYALARVLGIDIPGAFLTAVAYEYSGFLYLSNTCCFPYSAVVSWLPLTILGVELAIRTPRWLERVLWWGTSGLALSQILAAWFGQGSYYALLALGGYVAYRTLISPPDKAQVGLMQRLGITYEMLGGPFLGAQRSDFRLESLRRFSRSLCKNLLKIALSAGGRLLRCALHGGAVLGFGFGLAAAGILPRLEYNALSSLAGGYPEAGTTVQVERVVGGWTVEDLSQLLEPGVWYAGAAILALALVAPLISWKRFAVPYFAALSVGALILSGQWLTPLHWVLYLLPRFEQLHPHNPDRVMVVFYLGAALLAGVALNVLGERAGKKPLLLVLAALVLADISGLIPLVEVAREETAGGWGTLSALLLKDGISAPAGLLLFFAAVVFAAAYGLIPAAPANWHELVLALSPPLALILAVVLVVAYALIPSRFVAWRGIAFALLALVVFADLLAVNRATIAEQYTGVRRPKMDLAEYYRPSDAAQFLQSRSEEEPFRYFGFGPQYVEGLPLSGPQRFTESKVQALEVSNRATPLGLQSIQGYSAVRIARYDKYMKVLNQYEQSYHYADVYDEYEEDLDSPLLDLLGVRYIIVPADSPPESQPGLQRVLRAKHPAVYEDDQLKVLENPKALPRTWIVHSARQVRSEDEALDLLSAGQVDPRETAFLEDAPPDMSQPDDPSADQASVTEYGANQIQLKTDTGAAGLLVLSEVYYPAWKAYVDGQPVPVHVADQLLRSVPIPAGEHTVELRYESWTLRAGIVISLITCAALIALAVVAVVRRRRRSADDSEITPGGP